MFVSCCGYTLLLVRAYKLQCNFQHFRYVLCSFSFDSALLLISAFLHFCLQSTPFRRYVRAAHCTSKQRNLHVRCPPQNANSEGIRRWLDAIEPFACEL